MLFLGILQIAPSVFATVIFLLLILIAIVSASIRIVPEYERLAVFRVGRFVGVKGPGIVVLLPLVDRGIRLDLRSKEEVLETEALTRDGFRVTVRAKVVHKIVDPEQMMQSRLGPWLIPPLVEAEVRDRIEKIRYEELPEQLVHLQYEIREAVNYKLKRRGLIVVAVELLRIKAAHPVVEPANTEGIMNRKGTT